MKNLIFVCLFALLSFCVAGCSGNVSADGKTGQPAGTVSGTSTCTDENCDHAHADTEAGHTQHDHDHAGHSH